MKECGKCKIQYDDMLTFCRNCNGPLSTVCGDDVHENKIVPLICDKCKAVNPQDYIYCKKCAAPLNGSITDSDIENSHSNVSIDNVPTITVAETPLEQPGKEISDEEEIKVSEKTETTNGKKQTKKQDKVSSGNYIFKAIFATAIIVALFVATIIYYNNSSKNKDVVVQSPTSSPSTKAHRPKKVKNSIAPTATTKNEASASTPAEEPSTSASAPASSFVITSAGVAKDLDSDGNPIGEDIVFRGNGRYDRSRRDYVTYFAKFTGAVPERTFFKAKIFYNGNEDLYTHHCPSEVAKSRNGTYSCRPGPYDLAPGNWEIRLFSGEQEVNRTQFDIVSGQ